MYISILIKNIPSNWPEWRVLLQICNHDNLLVLVCNNNKLSYPIPSYRFSRNEEPWWKVGCQPVRTPSPLALCSPVWCNLIFNKNCGLSLKRIFHFEMFKPRASPAWVGFPAKFDFKITCMIKFATEMSPGISGEWLNAIWQELGVAS